MPVPFFLSQNSGTLSITLIGVRVKPINILYPRCKSNIHALYTNIMQWTKLNKELTTISIEIWNSIWNKTKTVKM